MNFEPRFKKQNEIEKKTVLVSALQWTTLN